MSFIEYYYTSAALELFAALVTLVMLLGCFIINTHRTTVGIFLVALLAAHMLSLLIDSPIWILLAAPSPERVPLIKVLSFLSAFFFIAADTSPFAFPSAPRRFFAEEPFFFKSFIFSAE